MHDIRYAWRLMPRQPMFAAVVIGTLTLGIGASTSMFSVVNGVLLTPLSYGNPGASEAAGSEKHPRVLGVKGIRGCWE